MRGERLDRDDVELKDILADAKLAVERNRRQVSAIGLNENNRNSARGANAPQLFDQAGRHAFAAMLRGDREVVNIDFAARLLELRPAALVIVSCDPATLARDLARLTPAYSIDKLTLVDLFPQTFHLETIVSLSLSR